MRNSFDKFLDNDGLEEAPLDKPFIDKPTKEDPFDKFLGSSSTTSGVNKIYNTEEPPFIPGETNPDLLSRVGEYLSTGEMFSSSTPIGDITKGTAETTANLALGAGGWIVGKINSIADTLNLSAKDVIDHIAHLDSDKLFQIDKPLFSPAWLKDNFGVGGKRAKEIAERGKQIEEGVGGMMQVPTTTKSGAASTQLAGEIIETALAPIKMATAPLEQFDPRIRHIVEFGSELAAFKMFHEVGGKAVGAAKEVKLEGAPKKFVDGLRRLRNVFKRGDEAKIKEGVDSLMDASVEFADQNPKSLTDKMRDQLEALYQVDHDIAVRKYNELMGEIKDVENIQFLDIDTSGLPLENELAGQRRSANIIRVREEAQEAAQKQRMLQRELGEGGEPDIGSPIANRFEPLPPTTERVSEAELRIGDIEAELEIAERNTVALRDKGKDVRKKNEEAKAHLERIRDIRKTLNKSRVEHEELPRKVDKDFKSLLNRDRSFVDIIKDWITDKSDNKPSPPVLYRGVQKGSDLLPKEGFVHGTPWARSAAEAGKGGFGSPEMTDVFEFPVDESALYYRGGSLAGDPLERTRIKNAQGMTWNELLDATKELYQYEFIRERAKVRNREGRDLYEGEQRYILEEVINDLKNASFETDLAGYDGIWRGKHVPDELNRTTPRLRSIEDLKEAVIKKRKQGFSDEDIPELRILDENADPFEIGAKFTKDEMGEERFNPESFSDVVDAAERKVERTKYKEESEIGEDLREADAQARIIRAAREDVGEGVEAPAKVVEEPVRSIEEVVPETIFSPEETAALKKMGYDDAAIEAAKDPEVVAIMREALKEEGFETKPITESVKEPIVEKPNVIIHRGSKVVVEPGYRSVKERMVADRSERGDLLSMMGTHGSSTVDVGKTKGFGEIKSELPKPKNPYRLGNEDNIKALAEEATGKDISELLDVRGSSKKGQLAKVAQETQEYLESRGYDGIEYTNTRDVKEPFTSFVSFGEKKRAEGKTFVGYHGTSSIYIEGIKKEGLRPRSLGEIVENVLDDLGLKGTERKRAIEKIENYDYFKEGDRPREESELYITKSEAEAKDYAKNAGEVYDNALIALGAFDKNPKGLAKKAADKLNQNRSGEPIVLKVKATRELKRGDNIFHEPLEYEIISDWKGEGKRIPESIPEYPNANEADVYYRKIQGPRSGWKYEKAKEVFDNLDKDKLNKQGWAPELVKIGDRYKIGIKSNLDLALEAGEELGKGIGISSGVDVIAPRETRYTLVSAERAFEHHTKRFEEIRRWEEGDTSVDIDKVQRIINNVHNITDTTASFVDSKGVLHTYKELSDVVAKLNERINLKRHEKALEQPGADPEIFTTPHPNESQAKRGEKVIVQSNGEFFDNPIKAVGFMKEKKIEGYVDSTKDVIKPGYYIETKKPRTRSDLLKKIEKRGDADKLLAHRERVAKERLERKESEYLEGIRKTADEIRKAKKEPRKETTGVTLGSGLGAVKLTPGQIQAAKNVINAAGKAGKDIAEYLKDLGYRDFEVEKIAKLVEAVLRNADPQERTDNAFQTGRNMLVTKEVSGRKKVPAYEGEVNEVFSEGDISQAKTEVGQALKTLTKEFLNPIRTFEEAGDGIKRIFYDPYLRAEKTWKLEWDVVKEDLRDIKKGINYKSSQRIGKYAISQQINGIERLQKRGVTDIPKWEELAAKEQGAYTALRKRFEEIFVRVNEAREAIGKPRLRYEPDYFTFAYDKTAMERIGLEDNSVIDHVDTIYDKYAQFSTTPDSFSKHRSKSGLKKDLDLDAFKVYEKYMRETTRHIHISPIIAKVEALRSRVDKVNPDTGKQMRLAEAKPKLDNFLLRWSNFLAGKDVSNWFSSTDGTVIGKVANKLNRNLAFALLSWNIRSALIQASAFRNSLTYMNHADVMYGVGTLFNKMSTQEALKKSNVLITRGGSDVIFSDIFDSIKSTYYGEALKKGGEWGLAPLQYLDMQTAIATWNGAYRNATMKRGYSPSEAIRFADDVVIKTQASALPGDLSPIQRSAVGKSLTLFQTFVINDWGFLTRDVLGIGNKSINNKVAVERAVRYVAATALMNVIFEDVLQINSPFPTPVRELHKDLSEGANLPTIALNQIRELTEPMPIVGNARYGSNFLGPVANVMGELSESVSGKPGAKKFYEPGMKIIGVPGSQQFFKSVRADKRGESGWGVIVGKYTEPTSSRRIRSRKRSRTRERSR